MPDTAELRIHASELSAIAAEVSRYPEVETGGSLFGLWSHGRTPTVLYASLPGPSAVRANLHYREDVAAHKALEADLWRRFGIQCVGLWHSHHKLGLHDLSAGDVERTRRYARRSGRAQFCEVLAYYLPEAIGLKPFVYPDAPRGYRIGTHVVTLRGTSPVRQALEEPLPASGGLEWETEPYVPNTPIHRLIASAEAVVDQRIPKKLQASVTLDLQADAAILQIADRSRRLKLWIAEDERVRQWVVFQGETTVAASTQIGHATEVVPTALSALNAGKVE